MPWYAGPTLLPGISKQPTSRLTAVKPSLSACQSSGLIGRTARTSAGIAGRWRAVSYESVTA